MECLFVPSPQIALRSAPRYPVAASRQSRPANAHARDPLLHSAARLVIPQATLAYLACISPPNPTAVPSWAGARVTMRMEKRLRARRILRAPA